MAKWLSVRLQNKYLRVQVLWYYYECFAQRFPIENGERECVVTGTEKSRVSKIGQASS